MLFCLLRSHRSKKKHRTDGKKQKKPPKKPCFPKEQVENADLYKPVLSQIMTTREYYIKQNFAALLCQSSECQKQKYLFQFCKITLTVTKFMLKRKEKKDRLTKFLPYSVSTSEIVKDNHIIQL